MGKERCSQRESKIDARCLLKIRREGQRKLSSFLRLEGQRMDTLIWIEMGVTVISLERTQDNKSVAESTNTHCTPFNQSAN